MIDEKKVEDYIEIIHKLFDEWKLKPVEEEIFLMFLQKNLKGRNMAGQQNKVFNSLLGQTMKKFGMGGPQ